MKKIQVIRLAVQLSFMILFVFGLFIQIPNIMLIIMIFAVLLGPVFCGFVCPYGFMQDLSTKLGRLLGIKQVQMPRKLQKYLVFARYIVFILVGVYTTGIVMQLLGFEPRTNFLKFIGGNTITVGAIIVMVAFLIIGLFFKRPFCNYLCYEGAKYGLMGAIRPFRIKRNERSCVSCKKCDKACPMNIEISTSKKVNSLQCVNCYECVSSCPIDNTLKVSPIIGEVNQSIKNGELKTWLEAKITKKNISIGIGAIIILMLLMKANKENQPFPEYVNTQAVVIDGEDIGLSDAKGFKDGIYKGEAEGFNGIIKTDVTIEDERIVSIVVTSHQDDGRWFNHAYEIVPNEIITNQTTNVDAVSMATYSSSGIINSVKNALGQEDYLEVDESRRGKH